MYRLSHKTDKTHEARDERKAAAPSAPYMKVDSQKASEGFLTKLQMRRCLVKFL